MVWLAVATTVSKSASMLLPGLGSVTPLGVATVAVLIRLPLVAITVALTLISYHCPAASVGSANNPRSSWYGVGMKPDRHWPGAAEQTTAVLLSPATGGSLRIAPVTLLGPLLVTVMM